MREDDELISASLGLTAEQLPGLAGTLHVGDSHLPTQSSALGKNPGAPAGIGLNRWQRSGRNHQPPPSRVSLSPLS